MTINFSTISGNVAGSSGGGIHATGDVTISSSTITGNSARYGGGGIRASENVTITNSTVAGNTDDGTGRDLLSFGSELEVRHSLIGSSRGTELRRAPLGSADANGNLIGGSTRTRLIDALIGPLTDNGGPTFTHALLPGSPAINMGDPLAMAGSDDVPQFDQRGAPYSRIVEGRMDMGALERGIAGDANGDGKVDFADFLVLSANFGTGQGWSEGNFDGSEDGTQFADFLGLSANFGREEPNSGELGNARRTAAPTSGVTLDIHADHRRRTELVDELLASAPLLQMNSVIAAS